MLASQNIYVPITLAPSEVRSIVIENVVQAVPCFDAKLYIRNIEPLLTIPVTFTSTLIITDAAMAFNGDWENTLLDSTIAPEGLLIVTVPTIVDGQYTNYTLTLTNPDVAANALLHLYINGSYESLSIQNIQTTTVLP